MFEPTFSSLQLDPNDSPIPSIDHFRFEKKKIWSGDLRPSDDGILLYMWQGSAPLSRTVC